MKKTSHIVCFFLGVRASSGKFGTQLFSLFYQDLLAHGAVPAFSYMDIESRTEWWHHPGSAEGVVCLREYFVCLYRIYSRCVSHCVCVGCHFTVEHVGTDGDGIDGDV